MSGNPALSFECSLLYLHICLWRWGLTLSIYVPDSPSLRVKLKNILHTVTRALHTRRQWHHPRQQRRQQQANPQPKPKNKFSRRSCSRAPASKTSLGHANSRICFPRNTARIPRSSSSTASCSLRAVANAPRSRTTSTAKPGWGLAGSRGPKGSSMTRIGLASRLLPSFHPPPPPPSTVEANLD